MTFRLRDNLYWCLCGGRVIFLDVKADRYFCLPFGPEAAFARLAAGDVEPGDAERLRALIARGLLIEDPASRGLRPPSPLEPATGDLLQEPYPPPRIRDLLGALAFETRAAWLLRTRPFLQVVKGVERRGTQCRSPHACDKRLRRIASASATISLLLRAADRCLVRALAVHATCCRHGIRPRLVLGVRVNPFGAHCWVQLDQTVLVGDFEQVRLFTPIVAFG